MRVLHVIPSISLKHGGPSVALPLIARSLAQAGVSVDVATTDDDGPRGRLDVPLAQPVNRNGVKHFFFRKQTEFYKVSLPFCRWINQHVHDYDIVHIHALFSHTSVCAARAARRHAVPYVVRPLGVLNRWGMANRRRRLKALSFRFIERPVLRHAAAIHYTSCAEELEARECGVRTPSAVVPLGIDVDEFQASPGPDLFLERFPAARGRELVLFLSRLDAKKGLDLLLPAFGQVAARRSKVALVLAGSGDARYMESLRNQAQELRLDDRVIWAGFLSGREKLSAMAAATVFTLPSYSENFGIAAVEALAAGLACVVTEGVAVGAEMRNHDAGLVVPAEVRELAAALERVLADATLRQRLGENAKRLALERFSIAAMGGALKDVYLRILQTAPAQPVNVG